MKVTSWARLFMILSLFIGSIPGLAIRSARAEAATLQVPLETTIVPSVVSAQPFVAAEDAAPASAAPHHALANALLATGQGMVSAGGEYSCSLRDDGLISCWGKNNYGQASPPGGTFSQISAGFDDACGLRSDGTLACWGRKLGSSIATPSGIFTQVSVGGWPNTDNENFPYLAHACAIKSDGRVNCWGNNDYGQASPPEATFSQISAGPYHTCGIRTSSMDRFDGILACWGNPYATSTVPDGTFVQISAGDRYTCGVRSDGIALCWGMNNLGSANSPLPGTYSQVAAGTIHTCGVRGDGTIFCQGSNAFGQGTPPSASFRMVSVGGSHTCGLRSDNGLQCWGNNVAGQAPVVTVAEARLAIGQVATPYPPVTFSASTGVPPYTFSALGLPPGLSIGTDGTLRGTPTNSGSFDMTVMARDSRGIVGERLVNLLIAPLITLEPLTLPNGQTDVPYNQNLTAGGGSFPYDFTHQGLLPNGLTLDTTGTLHGTPTTSGNFTFTIVAEDVYGFTGSRTYSLVVAPAITIVPATLRNGQVASAYRQNIFAGGGARPYRFAVTAGALPPGIVLSPAGVLAGTPSGNGGEFSFTVSVTDANGYGGSRDYTLQIGAQIGLSPATLNGGRVGVAYGPVTLSASGGTSPYSFTTNLTLGELPPGLVLDANGTLRGTPSSTGVFNFTLTATDANGFSGNQFYSLPVGLAPVISLGAGVLAYGEGDPPTPIDSAASFSAADDLFAGGKLTLVFTAGGTADDRLNILAQGDGAGQIGVDSSTISYGGTVIATFVGGFNGATPLEISFNAATTRPAVQALLQRLSYQNVGDNPATEPRTVQAVLVDGAGGTSNAATRSIQIATGNRAPTISTIGEQIISPSSATNALQFTIGDRETPVANLRLEGSSSNQSLVPDTQIVFGGAGADQTVTITPAQGQTGNVTITLSVSDGALVSTTSFLLKIELSGAATIACGAITVQADGITTAGTASVAAGNIQLGTQLSLAGADAGLTIDQTAETLSGSGTLTLRSGNFALFSGAFTADCSTGTLRPADDVSYAFDEVAGFAVGTALALSEIDVPDGVANGAASLQFTPPGIDAAASANFTIAPGPTFGGTLEAFTIAVAGTTVQIPAGVAIGNDRISMPSATLALPAAFGGASSSLSNVLITPDSFSLGEGTVNLPQITIGNGSKLRFNDNSATLGLDPATSTYRFGINSTLNLNLPGNAQQIAVNLTLADAGGGVPQLAGSLSGLSLSLAGSTLALNTLAISNAGLAVERGTLSLPARLGGSTTLNAIRITSDGLSISDGTFALPDIRIGSGQQVNITQPTARLAVLDNGYGLSANGTFNLNLPNNTQTAALGFTIENSDVSATIASLNLNLAGTSLELSDVRLNSAGLSSGSAMLRLPAKLGGATGSIAQVRITDSGLDFGSAGVNVTLPDVRIGSRISLTDNAATLAIEGSGAQAIYRLTVNATVRVSLPKNNQSSAMIFSLVKDGSGVALTGQLSSLSLTIAGNTLALTDITLTSEGMTAARASLTLPPRLGGATGAVQGVSITSEGLRIGGATISLGQDIKFGNGSKLRIAQPRLSFVIAGDNYSFSASGTLHINLPGNAQNTPIGFNFTTDGDLSGTVGRLNLKVAGSTIALQNMQISLTGLRVAEASLTVRGTTGLLRDIAISEEGLSIGGGGITLPSALKLAGERAVLLNPRITIQAESDGYTMGIAGSLKLTLPQNNQTIPNIALSVSTSGQFKGTISQLDLQLGTITLKLTSIAIDNNGLFVQQGTLLLPPTMGGASGGVSEVRINETGLSIGGASATVPFPDFKLGSANGFAVTAASATVAVASDWSYKVTIAGTVTVTIPSSSTRATGSILIDGQGNVTGSLSGLTLNVAGLTLGATNVRIQGDTLKANSATFTTPVSFGGLSAAVYNVDISPTNGLSIGGGKFKLPTIKAGGFTMGLEGGLKPILSGTTTIGYEITAGGTFGVPGMGASAGCSGIGVSVTITTDALNTMTMTIKQPTTIEEMQQVLSAQGVPTPQIARGQTLEDAYATLDAVRFRQASLTLNCQIPIANTGLFLASASGTVTLNNDDSVQVDIAVRIVAGRQIAGFAVLSIDGTTQVKTSPFELGLGGVVKLFSFITVSQARALIKADSFSATLNVKSILVDGTVAINAWSNSGGFHFTGSGDVKFGLREGSIYKGCVDTFLFGEVCVNIPPVSAYVATKAQAGEFQNGTWGFKGEVCYIGQCAGAFIDTNGNLTAGLNLDQYRLLTPSQIAQAHGAGTKPQPNPDGSLAAAEPGLQALANDAVLVTVPVTVSTDLLFGLTRTGAAPLLSLITPTGVEIQASNLPPNVQFTEYVTTTLNRETNTPVTLTQVVFVVTGAQMGQWKMKVSGTPSPDEPYVLAAVGKTPAPVLSDMSAIATGATSAELRWRLVASAPNTTLSIYATPDSSTNFTGETVAVALAGANRPGWANGTSQTYRPDLSRLPSGTYRFWLEADDGRNVPVRAYVAQAITIAHPWSETWRAASSVTPGYRKLDLAWDAHPNPDVDGYLVNFNSLGVTRVISVGNVLATTLDALTAGETYSVTITAYDDQSPRTSRSETVTATPQSAPFTIGAEGLEFSARAGEAGAINLTLTTALESYPEPVGLALAQQPDGFVLAFDRQLVTPLIGGAAVTLVFTPSATLANGTYRIPLVAQGAGESHTLDLAITIAGTGFSIAADPSSVTLSEGQAASINISTARLNGARAPLVLSLANAPDGLDYHFGASLLEPGAGTTLLLSDTTLLNHGSYSLLIQGSDGVTTAVQTLTLTVEPHALDTFIDTQPANPTRGSDAVLSFRSTLADGLMLCSLDGADLVPCTSPQSYSNLSDGPHSFTVQAIDALGKRDLSPARADWMVDTTPPLVSISAEPAHPSNTTTASFSFSVVDNGVGVATIECSLDDMSFTPCTSPASFSGLSNGSHSFAVQASDTLGNRSAPVRRSWVIATTRSFPSTPSLDTFTRANGPLGENWRGWNAPQGLRGYTIINRRLAVQQGGPVYWHTRFGSDQEAFVTLSHVDKGAHEQNLLLKVQNRDGRPNWRGGVIQALYDAKRHQLRVETYQPSRGWQVVARFAATMKNGDQLGARAHADGTVELYRNGNLVGSGDTRTTNGQFFVQRSGRIGLWFVDADAARLDNFGGGTAASNLAASESILDDDSPDTGFWDGPTPEGKPSALLHQYLPLVLR